MSDEDKEEITIRDLYPHLSEEEHKEAKRNLDRFAALLWRIAKRQADEDLDKE